MKRSRICALRAPRCSRRGRRVRADASQTWRNCSLHISPKNISPQPRRSPISTVACQFGDYAKWRTTCVSNSLRRFQSRRSPELVELSPFHFSRVFKQATGMSPLQFVTRERITRAQQLIRETSRSLIDSCVGGWLYQSEPFRKALSAGNWCDTDRVPRLPVARPPSFCGKWRNAAQDRARRAAPTGGYWCF